MSEHIDQAIETLEHELEAIDQKRGDIESAIGALRRLADEGLTSNGNGRPKRKSKRRGAVRKNKKIKRQAARQTDGRTDGAKTAPSRSAEPP